MNPMNNWLVTDCCRDSNVVGFARKREIQGDFHGRPLEVHVHHIRCEREGIPSRRGDILIENIVSLGGQFRFSSHSTTEFHQVPIHRWVDR